MTSPAESRFGFKEWKLICDRLENGHQAILLRKGGIAEGKYGFQWLHQSFFLFPSYFHEQAAQLRPLDDSELPEEEIPTSERESVEIRLFAEIIEDVRLTDRDRVEALEPFHGWKREVIEERFAWGDEPGISVAVVRAYRLSEPWTLVNRKGFGGCRSWLGLPEEEGLPASWREQLQVVTSEESIDEVRAQLSEG